MPKDYAGGYGENFLSSTVCFCLGDVWIWIDQGRGDMDRSAATAMVQLAADRVSLLFVAWGVPSSLWPMWCVIWRDGLGRTAEDGVAVAGGCSSSVDPKNIGSSSYFCGGEECHGLSCLGPLQ